MSSSITDKQRYGKRQVAALAFSVFVFNTTEFVPIALLSDIGASFGKTEADVGMMVGLYAAIVAVFSLPAMLATAKIERKSLLICLFVLFVFAHLLSAQATSYGQFVFSRILVALCHTVFWSIVASLAVRLAPKDWQTKALGMIAIGGSLAMVMGIPLGRVLGQYLSWQATFLAIAVLGFLVLTLYVWLLPKLPAKNAGNLASVPQVVKNKSVMGLYVALIFGVTANFTAYSYIEPLVGQLVGSRWVTPVLFGFGVAGLLASMIFGRWYDEYQNRFLTMAMAIFMVSLLLIYPVGLLGVGAVFLGLSVVWGVGAMLIGLGLQLQVLDKNQAHQDVAMAIFSSLYNVGIMAGAMVGAGVMQTFGVSLVGFFGAVMVMAAMLIYQKTQT